jgi:hypothetical protein
MERADAGVRLTNAAGPAGCESRRIGISEVGVYGRRVAREIFITMAKVGSTVVGLTDAFATVVSLASRQRHGPQCTI